MTKEEAKKFGLHLLQGIMERNESYPVYANNVKQAIDALSESGSSEIPKDLEEAAGEYEKKHTYQRYDGGGLTPEYDATLAEAFIAGYNLCREQMLKEAVEGEVYLYHSYKRDATAIFVDIPKETLGDKVKIIIIKEEENGQCD